MSVNSDQTGVSTSGTASILSAEAAEFVPGRFTQGDKVKGNAGGRGRGLEEVPRYITTCYPFINPALAQRAKAGGDSAGAGSVGGSRAFVSSAAYGAGAIRHPTPHLGPFPQQVGYPPSPLHPWLSSLQPTFTPAMSMGPMTPGVHVPFDGGTPGGGRGLLPTPSKGDGLLPTPPYPPTMSGQTVLQAPVMMQYPAAPQVFVSPDGTVLPATAARGRGAQAGRGRGANVSRGTQKEAFILPPGGRSHTLIMKDNSVQTDFNKDIADLTLQEKASILFRRGQRRNKASQPITSTDSEEVDSDSGYSSPLHRRNLVSNGTHPVRISTLVEVAERGKSTMSSSGKGLTSSQINLTPLLGSNPGQQSGGAGGGVMSRAQKDSPAASPLVWGREVSSSSSPGLKDSNRSSPAVVAAAGTKDPSLGKSAAQRAGSKERSRTPVSFKDSPTTEESVKSKSPSGGGVMQKALNSGSSPGVPSKLAGPGSMRGGDSAVSPPDFPILKPAKRNEPPWSLTPNVQKGKKGENSGFMGMMADSVKSYASIVKSLSSPTAAHPSPSQPHVPLSQPVDVAADFSGSRAVASTKGDSSGKGTDNLGVGLVHSHVGGVSGSSQGAWGGGKRPAWGGAGRGKGGQEPGLSGGKGVQAQKQGSGEEIRQGWVAVTNPLGVGAQRAAGGEVIDYSKQQHCDTQANQIGAGTGEGGDPSLPPSHSPVKTAAQETRGAASPAPDKPRPRIDDSPAKGGNRTDSTHAASGDEKTDEEGKKKPRRRRHRRRRRKTKSTEREGGSDGMSGMERTISSSNISRTSDVTLHFEDEQEFPEIGAASGNEASSSMRSGVPLGSGSLDPDALGFRRVESSSSLSYSDILRSKPTLNDVRSRTQSAPGSCLSGEEGGDENFNSQPGQGSTGQTSLSKRARKRRKRRELANRAAEAELAEISLEQQMLRELGHKVTGRGSRPSSGSREEKSRSREEKSPARGLITDANIVKQSKGGGAPGGSGKRLHQPIALNIADMLDAFEKKKNLDQKMLTSPKAVRTLRDEKGASLSGNVLDANAPAKRGKEREAPKPKKPSPLKKVILKEREEKKRMRLIGDCDIYPEGLPDDTDGNQEAEDSDHNLIEEDTAGNPGGLEEESDLSQDGMSSRSVDTDQGVSPGADLSPISQTSPISMSPLTPGASPLNSPIAGYLSRDPVVLRIHSRRFREYCTQILDKDIDTCCTSLLHELVRFQDRMYHKDPTKAKGKRRVVLGLREVTKHLKLKKIKCVVISPNLEKIQSKGGLDEALNNILNMCQEQNVPFVFALGRRALGRACAKLVPVSVAGIFNYEGCEEKFNQLISLTHKGREAYSDMVQAVEHEIAENPPPSLSAGSSVPSLYAHMGHSRTPSGCSAISFTSSVLSEPISENYPHAEPETDSKGYEIVRDLEGKVVPPVSRAVAADYPSSAGFQDDIDDGNEADTEDINDFPRLKKRTGSGTGLKKAAEEVVKSVSHADKEETNSAPPVPAVNHVNALTAAVPTEEAERRDGSEDGDSVSESDSQRNLPPIDSIHTSAYDLSAEILSQHSSRNMDNVEALSTHSSRTLGDGSLTPNLETARDRDRPHTPESSGGKSGRGGSRHTKDRVQSWVESCLQEEEQNEGSGSDGGEEGTEGEGE
ncbi:uncharacterized protein [Littorina saxatilis]|uniref:Ribosomal protein eL8/eL30/eS12/Gadd45 domain-containing protein n=1 Tax=Littorina saxatilis TaxID=31220 RepID=A0AAN9AZ54_9CAEN